MKRSLAMQAQIYLASRQQNHRRAIVLRCLAVVVAFATAYALIMPAVTQSNAVLCGMEEHVHTDACWTVEMIAPQPELICTAGRNGETVIHTHDDNCYDRNGELICTLPEREVHVHGSDCYREFRELICTEHQDLGHTHGPSCYTYVRGALICGQEEDGGGHVHTDACYRVERGSEPICGQEEDGGGHVHTDACYRVERGSEPACGQEEGGGGHVHTDACYTMQRSSEPACSREETEGHTHTDACYTDKETEVLSCGLPESDDVLDEAGNLIQPGHRHDNACYTTETERVLSCGERESEGHQHTDACYPMERVLTCTQEEGEGHVHTDACYPESRTLICGEEESRGHIHTDACYPEEKVLICEEEGQGHIHSDSCYEWTQELHCQEEEREPGHIHTDECYEITELLVCREEELIPHVHTDGCYEYIYDEETGELLDEVLVCSKPEVIYHQHTAECFYTPEGEPVETRVLTCGKEEHVHSEECFVEIAPKEEEIYFCGKKEHIHSAECYFESGELRCTIPEHVHSLACLEEQPPVLEIPEESRPERVELDEYFTYETEAFSATFHATGIATLTDQEDDVPPSWGGGDGEQAAGQPAEPPVDDGSGTGGSEDASGPQEPNIPDPAPDEPNVPDEPSVPDEPNVQDEPNVPDEPAADSGEGEYGIVISGDIDVPMAGSAIQARSAFRPEDDAWSDDASQQEDTFWLGDISQSEDSAWSEDASQPGDNAWSGDTSQPGDNTWPEDTVWPGDFSQPEDRIKINFQVSEPEQGSMEYEEIASSVPKTEEEEPIILSVLTFSVMAEDGRMVDLSQCRIEAEVVFKETLVDALVNMESEPMAIDGVEVEEEQPEQTAAPEIMLGAFAGGDVEAEATELSSVVVNEETAAGPVAMLFSVSAETQGVAFTAQSGQFPKYTVEYYAVLNRPVTTTANDPSQPLTFINTDGKNLPTNGTTPALKYLAMDLDNPNDKNSGGKVRFEAEETRIYQTAHLQYNTVGSDGGDVKFKDISEVVGTSSSDGVNIYDENGELHQTLKEIRVKHPGDTDWKTYPSAETADLVTYFDNLKFVNMLTAENENTIAITEGTQLQVVYQPTSGNAGHTATFYDYDISTGPSDATSETTLNTAQQGINDSDNYANNGNKKYAFGNNNAGTGLGEENWNGNNINMANKKALGGKDGFNNCAFKLATGTSRDGGLNFASGIDAPNLFGDDEKDNPTKGRTVYNGQSLGFVRNGDTYTLSTVSGEDSISASGLESFGAPTKMYGTGTSTVPAVYFRSNSFWPMDGVTNTDPHTGGGEEKDQPLHSGKGHLPASDDKKDHNNYFGMHFTVGFTVPKRYCGPLEYYFYGDDDMWVFLQNTQSGEEDLVCDIGGVHQSVGEYVDLWDYVLSEGETPETPRDGDRTFYLEFFYTERGASGSTCWMQFTLPNTINVSSWTSTETPKGQYLRLEKKVNSNVGADAGATYKFNISLFGTSVNSFDILKQGTAVEQIKCGETKEIELKVGEKIEIRGLPNDTRYLIQEVTGDRDFDVSYMVNGKAVDGDCAGEITEGSNKAEIVCTNYFRAQLPATGGPGDYLYTWAGTLLIAAACCLWYKRRNTRGGARDET